MNNIMKFENKEFGQIRAVELNGEPWFIGKDVAEKLGYAEPRSTVSKKVDKEDRGVAKIETPSGIQEMTVINESGLYSLILSSHLESAKKFKRWVTSEVLPQIRKTGSYSIDNQVKLLEDKNNKLEEEIQELKEAVNLSIQQFKPSHRTKLQYSKLIRNLTSTDEEYKFIKEWVFSCMNITKWEDVCVQDDKKVREIIFTVARLSIINKMEQLSFDIGDEA